MRHLIWVQTALSALLFFVNSESMAKMIDQKLHAEDKCVALRQEKVKALELLRENIRFYLNENKRLKTVGVSTLKGIREINVSDSETNMSAGFINDFCKRFSPSHISEPPNNNWENQKVLNFTQERRQVYHHCIEFRDSVKVFNEGAWTQGMAKIVDLRIKFIAGVRGLILMTNDLDQMLSNETGLYTDFYKDLEQGLSNCEKSGHKGSLDFDIPEVPNASA